jgi:hypothetical protein
MRIRIYYYAYEDSFYHSEECWKGPFDDLERLLRHAKLSKPVNEDKIRVSYKYNYNNYGGFTFRHITFNIVDTSNYISYIHHNNKTFVDINNALDYIDMIEYEEILEDYMNIRGVTK